jgi:hypothetical protein
MGTADMYFTNPVIEDYALYALAKRFPKKYTYERLPSFWEAERSRTMAINLWRKEQGQKRLPLPGPRVVKAVPAKILDPLLGQLIRAKKESDRSAVAGRIAAKGLGALPGISRRLKSISKGDPAHGVLDSLARSLACCVVKVESIGPDNREIESWLSPLVGRSLTSDALLGIAKNVVGRWPKGARGVEIRAIRDNDGGGVIVVVQQLSSGEVFRADNDLDTFVDVRLRMKQVDNSRGSGIGSLFGSQWPTINLVLSSDPFDPFYVALLLATQKP